MSNKKNIKLTDQHVTAKLIGRNVLLMIKDGFKLIEVTIIEFTQHRVKIKLIGKPDSFIQGMRKNDVVLFPMRTPRPKLKKLIKSAENSDENFKDYIDQYGYNLEE